MQSTPCAAEVSYSSAQVTIFHRQNQAVWGCRQPYQKCDNSLIDNYLETVLIGNWDEIMVVITNYYRTSDRAVDQF